ncbi:MAG: twin-arginine translocase subunit TatB [Sneathiella sp.]|nr:twin-arginine translocase subunit TatB [Sneathiella sp.]
MFDIGWSEMVFVMVIAVLVIGPKDLPKTIATIGKYIRKARGLARDFQSGLDDLAKETELDEIRKDIQSSTDFNLKKQIEDAVGSTGSFENMFDDIKPEIKADNTESSSISAPSDTPENNISGDAVADANPSPDTKVS